MDRVSACFINCKVLEINKKQEENCQDRLLPKAVSYNFYVNLSLHNRFHKKHKLLICLYKAFTLPQAQFIMNYRAVNINSLNG